MVIYAEALFNQLREMVGVLAAPADGQIKYMRTLRHPVPVDELYLQLDDSVPSWFPRLRRHNMLDDQVEESLLKLHDALERMREDGDLGLWEDSALYVRPEWEHVRDIARSALALMGPAKEVPSGPPEV
jgi:hypothetical protein